MQEQGMKIPQYLSKGISDGSISFKSAAKQMQNAINWTDLIQKAKDAGVKVPDSVAQGISSGQYAVPTSVQAVKNLVTFEDLKAKAQQGGIQVPDYLANAITSGSGKPKEAAAALSRMISFQEAITKAGIDGEKKVLYELKNSNMDLVVLQDICIRAKDGREAQIDFVIVTSKLMILLECKNLVGNIEIDSKGNFIRTIQYGKRYWKEGIYSPITQNERHMGC